MKATLTGLGVVLAACLVLAGGCASPPGEALTDQDVRISLELAQQDKDGFPHAFRVTFENASGRRAVVPLPGPVPGEPEGPGWAKEGYVGFGFKNADGREGAMFLFTDMHSTRPPRPEQLVLAPGERVERVYKVSDLYKWRPEGPVEGGRLSDHLGPGGQQLQMGAAIVYVAEEEDSEKPTLKSVVSELVVIRCSFDKYVLPEVEPEGPTTPLHRAVRRGDVKAVERLLAEGANVNARDKYENTPLHLAAGEGNVRIAEMLLAKGASLAALSSSGDTPLHRAARAGNVEVMKLLIAKGAEVDAKDSVIRGTPLGTAALEGQFEAAKLLLESGADPNVRDTIGDTPLCFAALRGHEKVVALLLDRGADIHAGGNGGLTPLHYAAADGRKNVVELLLARGADPNIKDRSGYTVLGWAEASRTSNRSTMQLLKQHGAKE